MDKRSLTERDICTKYSLSSSTDLEPMATERSLADVKVEIHPKVLVFLDAGNWLGAKKVASENRLEFLSEKFQQDGFKVTAGESWKKPFEMQR